MTKLATEIDFKLHNGLTIPALGLGTVPPENKSEVKQQIITAVKAGYRHIDTAWKYGSEEYIGEALKELFSEGTIKREDIFVTTKVWPSYWNNPEKSLDESLKRLGLDYVDLLLQHWPTTFKSDEDGEPSLPRDDNGDIIYDDDPVNGTKYLETYKGLEKILDNTSKVKSIGVSNYSIPRLKKLLSIAKHKPVVNQFELHPQLPQLDLVKFTKENDILVVAYSPVGSNGAPVLKLPLVKELAKKYDVTENEIINSYHIKNNVSLLPRSSNLERIKTIIRLPDLTDDELKKLTQIGIDNPKRYINADFGYGLGFKWWEGDTLSKEFV